MPSTHTDRAVSAFRDECFNCAQSVLLGFRPEMPVSEELLAEFKILGNGKAEGGRCGALHAALHLAKDQETQELLVAEFIKAAGSDKCKDIKAVHKFSCMSCVKLATTLLDNTIPKPPEIPELLPER